MRGVCARRFGSRCRCVISRRICCAFCSHQGSTFFARYCRSTRSTPVYPVLKLIIAAASLLPADGNDFAAGVTCYPRRVPPPANLCLNVASLGPTISFSSRPSSVQFLELPCCSYRRGFRSSWYSPRRGPASGEMRLIWNGDLSARRMPETNRAARLRLERGA